MLEPLHQTRNVHIPLCAYIVHLLKSTVAGSPPRTRKERAKAISPRTFWCRLSRKREDHEQDEQAQ